MKKTIKRTIAMTMAAVLSLGMLAGCGEKDDNKIIMGTNAEFPPFEFIVEEGKGVIGEFDGIDVAIAKKIADKLGKELVVENMQFDGLVAAVKSGKVDFAAAGMTVKPERKESVDFSDTYFVAEQVMVVAPDNETIKTAEDLKNADMVGVVMGYTGDSIVSDLIEDDKILRVSRGIDGVQEVKNGKLDAMVIDSATGIALAEKNGLKVVKDASVFEAEEYAIAVGKGNEELLTAINEVLAEMKANGEIDELAIKYNG